MGLSTSSSERWKRKAIPWALLLLLLAGPFLVPVLRPALQGVGERWALERLRGCALKADPVDCYRQGLSTLMQGGDYQRGARLCKALADPACYQAYGRLVPNPYLCMQLREAGGPAVQQCYLGNCDRP